MFSDHDTPDLDALEAMEKAATPGPWISDAPGCVAKHYNEGGKSSAAICGRGFNPSKEDESNADLIAAARNALPALIRAARERDELRENQSRLFQSEAALIEKLRAQIARAERAEARVKELPSPEAVEAAKDALREAIPHLPDEARESVADRCRQALARLEGR